MTFENILVPATVHRDFPSPWPADNTQDPLPEIFAVDCRHHRRQSPADLIGAAVRSLVIAIAIVAGAPLATISALSHRLQGMRSGSRNVARLLRRRPHVQ